MTTRRDESDSDPLPFVQFDRAAMPMVGVLAGCMKVSRQHATGALVTFWGMCSEPRVLERLLLEAKARGERPQLVLDGETAARRWEMAAEVRLEPVVLAEAGVLEQLPEGYRVRGLSRQFGVIERRLQSRQAGQKSGEARRQGVHESFSASSTGSSTTVERPLNDRLENETLVERPFNGRSTVGEQRSEVRGQRSEEQQKDLSSTLDVSVPEKPKKPTTRKALEDALTDDEWQVFEHWREELGHTKAVATPERKRLLAKWLKIYPVAALQRAIDGCRATPWNMGENPGHVRYDGLELILRDAAHIERFMAAAPGAARGAA